MNEEQITQKLETLDEHQSKEARTLIGKKREEEKGRPGP